MVDGKDNWGGTDSDTVVPFSRGLGGEESASASDIKLTREDVVIDLDRSDSGTAGTSTLQPIAVSHESFEGMDGSDSARGGLVAARGTVDGLVIRVDGRLDAGTMRQALDEFVSARSSFLSGQEVFLEWVGMRPSIDIEQSLTQLLTKSYGIAVKSVRLFTRSRAPGEGDDLSAGEGTAKPRLDALHSDALNSEASRSDTSHSGGSSLFGGVRTIGREAGGDALRGYAHSGGSGLAAGGSGSIGTALSAGLAGGLSSGSSVGRAPRTFQSPLSGSTLPWDEPDTRLIHATLRSGQKIESEHSLVIVGDVNSGAEVISGGDIVILGTLRGVAHAGAYEESGGGRVIFSLNMQPTQLRIGAVISRGHSSEVRGQDGKSSPEVARVDGTLIVVEPYHTKTVGVKSAAVKANPGPSTVGLLGRKRGAA